MADVVDLTEEEGPTMFWKGATRLTFNRFARHPREKYLTFDEILGPLDGVKKMLVSAYCIDEDWLFDKLRRVPEVLSAIHWDRNEPSPPSSRHAYWKNVTILRPEFPKFPNYGVMHTKLMLLFRQDSLRVVVSTGNLVDYDYGEVQNAVFLQDLPVSSTGPSTCQFKETLIPLLRKLRAASLIGELDRYDWSSVSALLVSAEPGYTPSNARTATGLASLRQLTAPLAHKHNLKPDTTLLECQGSSLGALTPQWLSAVLQCSIGSAPQPVEDVAERVRIVFPSMELVGRSPLGPGAFGTIFCKQKDWDSPTCPRASFRQCKGTDRAERPLHTKILAVFHEDQSAQPCYYYLGSANFTASAWGRFVKDGTQIMISNYELGVLLDNFEYPIVWPYQRPAEPYNSSDGPWVQ